MSESKDGCWQMFAVPLHFYRTRSKVTSTRSVSQGFDFQAPNSDECGNTSLQPARSIVQAAGINSATELALKAEVFLNSKISPKRN